MKKLILVLIVLLTTQLAFSQYLEQLETENFTEDGWNNHALAVNNYIYNSGYTKNNSNEREYFIRKLDTLGNEIWINYFLSTSPGYYDKMIMSENGFLFVSGNSQLIKVDTSTGAINYNTGTSLRPHQFSTDTFMNAWVNNQDLIIRYRSSTWGNILSTHYIPQGYNLNSSISFAATSGNHAIYCNIKDTLTKYDAYNLNSGIPIWKIVIPNAQIDFEALTYDSTQNVIYGFARDNNSSGSSFNHYRNIYKIDATNGNILWTYSSTQHNDYSTFFDWKEDANYIYTLWKSSLSNSRIILNKINKSTGNLEWVSSEYIDNSYYGDNHPFSLDIDASGIYVTAFGENYIFYMQQGLGIIKYDYNGNTIYKKVLSEFSYNYAGHSNVQLLANTINIIGSEKIPQTDIGKEVFIKIDKTTGSTLLKKDIGGKAILDGHTVAFETFNDGTFAVLQQKGKWSNFSYRDLTGTILWDTIIRGEAGHLRVVEDSITLVHIEGELHAFNRFTKQNVDWWPSVSNSTIDITKDLVNNRYVTARVNPNGDIQYFSLFQSPVNGAYSSVGHTEVGNNFGEDTKVILNWSATDFFAISQRKYFTLDKQYFNVTNTSSTLYDIWQFQYTDFAPGGSIMIIGKSNNGNTCLVRVNRNTLATYYIDDITTLPGIGRKFVHGEMPPYIYFISDDGTNISVTKYHIYNKAILWTKVVASSSSTHSLAVAKDITYNTLGDYISYTGYRENPTTGEREMLYGFLKSDGYEIANHVEVGDFAGRNQGWTVQTFDNNSTTLIGGGIHEVQMGSAASISYFNNDNINSSIVAKVFLDLNNNGTKEPNEPTINKGSVLINNEEYFPNESGIIKTVNDIGWETVTYQTPQNWILTSDSVSFTVNPYNPNFTNDTLCFGINGQFAIPSVEPFIIAQDFVCNLNNSTVLKIKNTGTTLEDIELKLAYFGTYNQADTTPNTVSNNELYWTLGDIAPGETKTINLDFAMPGVDSIGDTLTYRAVVYTYNNQTQIIQDSFEYIYQDVLLCAYDPNDKQVIPMGVGDDNLTLFDRYLNYTIRFQNTGNYPATNITITDTLENNLDLNTFEFIGASHDITQVLKEGHNLSFIFENIFLPDSVNNEPESHGFVSFRIKPIAGLPENTDINNTAHIYFDFNPAIVTNTTQNRLVSTIVATNNIKTFEKHYQVYPNPASNWLIIENLTSSINTNWTLHNSLGMLVKQGNYTGVNHQIDIEDLTNGLYVLTINNKYRVKILITK